jgi:hypothetical protein
MRRRDFLKKTSQSAGAFAGATFLPRLSFSHSQNANERVNIGSSSGISAAVIWRMTRRIKLIWPWC